MSLANTLDTLRETGSSAGGATALAQAALKSKQGISANIEQQEAQNEKLKAEGKQQMDMLKMQEATRIQGIQISEGQRVQGAEAQGKAFVFGAREDREQGAIDRVAGQLGIAGQQQAQANADTVGAITSGLGAIGSIGGAMASKTASPTTTQQRKAAENVDNSLTKVGNTPLTSTTQLNAVGQSPTSFVNEAYDYYDQQVEQLPG
jgi:enamine deaminase RidA (YjgF/YER057c/UK114 family)